MQIIHLKNKLEVILKLKHNGRNNFIILKKYYFEIFRLVTKTDLVILDALNYIKGNSRKVFSLFIPTSCLERYLIITCHDRQGGNE
jgi:tRNA uridine 5-carbamoylmethylation protein Kti12